MRALVFAVLALAACATQAAPNAGGNAGAHAGAEQNSPLEAEIRADNARLDGELRAQGIVAVGIGDTALLGDGLMVRPLRVLEDSRCPKDVTCVWAGRLRLRADVSGVEQEFTAGQPLQTAHGAVLLAIVKPSPWANWPGPHAPYRFGFRRS